MPSTNKTKNLVLHSTKPTTSASPAPEAAGWDPFEVWRTRVLEPRLAEARAEKPAPPAVVALPRR